MYHVFELDDSENAVFRGSFESEEEAFEAATSLVSYQVELDLGWGSQVLRKVTFEQS